VYRLDPSTGSIDRMYSGFGRPQGIAFDSQGGLYVVEALAGSNGLYRVRPDGSAELVVAGQSLVGVAFNPNGGMVVASNDTVYRLDVPIRPLA
jgi:sugar lactone lactonase YvrE